MKAWEIACIVQPHVRKKINPKTLIGPDKVKTVDQKIDDGNLMWERHIKKKRKVKKKDG